MRAMIVVLLAVMTGCDASSDATSSSTTSNLPTGAVNARDLGNHWIVFDLAIDGKQRTFLYRRVSNGAGNTATASEAITELVPLPRGADDGE